MDKSGGGGEGLKAKNSGGHHRSDTSVSGKSRHSTSSKKSMRSFTSQAFSTRGAGMYPSTSTMYKTAADAKTVRTNKTNATGMSFGGKSIGADGKGRAPTGPNAMSMPVMTTSVDKAIGGALAFSQVDQWTDNGLNKRASCDLWAATGAMVSSDLECRVSSMSKRVLVITFELSGTFTNPDEKLE